MPAPALEDSFEIEAEQGGDLPQGGIVRSIPRLVMATSRARGSTVASSAPSSVAAAAASSASAAAASAAAAAAKKVDKSNKRASPKLLSQLQSMKKAPSSSNKSAAGDDDDDFSFKNIMGMMMMQCSISRGASVSDAAG